MRTHIAFEELVPRRRKRAINAACAHFMRWHKEKWKLYYFRAGAQRVCVTHMATHTRQPSRLCLQARVNDICARCTNNKIV